MAKLFYVHWNEDECRGHARDLESAGHKVLCHWSKEIHAKIGDEIDVLIVSLDRLPSHGRAIAEWFWEAKKRQVKPLMFVGGEAPKVGDTKKKFPSALFCPRTQLTTVLNSLIRSPVSKAAQALGKPSRTPTRRSRTGTGT